MLNTLWPVFIIISFVFAIFKGSPDILTNSIFDSAKSAIDLSINLLRNNGVMVWNNEYSIKNFNNKQTL